jgi:flagellin-like protein
MLLRNRRGLSPVVSAVILIAVTVAVALVATTWLSTMTFSFTATEELVVTGCTWSSDASYADLTIKNQGTSMVTVQSAQISDDDASQITFVSGDSSVNAGETAVMRVFYHY